MKSIATVKDPYVRFVRVMALAVSALVLAAGGGRANPVESGSPSDNRDPASTEAGDLPTAGNRRLEPSDFRLMGGWRLAQEYPRGGLAIDFDSGRVFVGGHAQRQEIVEFSLLRRSEKTGKPETIAPGTGDDVMKWPRLDPVNLHPGFWQGGYVGGLYFKDNTLWASPKKFYDMRPPSSFHLYGKNLDTGKVETVLVELPRQEFGGGFVKGKPDTILLGCGGYESGQGSVSGPTLATIDGKALIRQANHGTMEFEKRELRPPTYWPAKRVDGWLALQPRDGIGRWACDRVHAGGIWHPRGIAYWALLGIGDLDYARQNETFAARNETWLYTYDPKTYGGVEFKKWDHGHVHGHDVAEDGRVYLLVRNAWRSGMARVDSVIKVFEIVD